MRRIFIKTSLLVLLAAIFVSGLPIFTQHSSTTSRESADAQTRSRRRPTVQRRSTGTNTAVVPVGTNLRVRLENNLSSKESRVGDRFTATVVNPTRFDGARVTGHISSLKQSGRVQG